MADDFVLDRLNSFNAKVRHLQRAAHNAASAAGSCAQTASACRRRQFALPGLLYRNIATTDLYSADWGIVGASITFKVSARRLCSGALRHCNAGACTAPGGR